MSNDKGPNYLMQCLDCNCNDCFFFSRDTEKYQREVKDVAGYKNQVFGHCRKFDKPINVIPAICLIETQQCFVHRKDPPKNKHKWKLIYGVTVRQCVRCNCLRTTKKVGINAFRTAYYLNGIETINITPNCIPE